MFFLPPASVLETFRHLKQTFNSVWSYISLICVIIPLPGFAYRGMVPGFAAKQAEDRKFKSDAASPKPVATSHGGKHTFVPFAVEDVGRLGAHARLHYAC